MSRGRKRGPFSGGSLVDELDEQYAVQDDLDRAVLHPVVGAD